MSEVEELREKIASYDYNYRDAVKQDVVEYIKENVNIKHFSSYDDLFEFLLDRLWVEDSVTGNGSGSYTFNTYQAECYIAHNWELAEESLNAFGDYSSVYEKGAEYVDVTIRCYLLEESICEALEELQIDENSFDFAED